MLKELFEKYGTDKTEYAQLYELLFRAWRTSPIALLEIGIGTKELMREWAGPAYQPGASLLAWRDYFLHGHIVGVDVVDVPLSTNAAIDKVILDSTEAAAVRAWSAQYFATADHPGFHIIIDDGSHARDDQLATASHFFPLLIRGGIYVIEDTADSGVYRDSRLPVIVAPSIPFDAIDGKCVIITK